MKKNHFVAAIIATSLLAGTPALAADDPVQKNPEALASEGIQNLMRAMELLLLSIPQFETPHMNENGDIIIRRKNPNRTPAEPDTKAPKGENGKTI